MPEHYDIIIIGGGVVGSMVARFLSRFQLRILLIEKEADIGMGTSSGNSAIIHAGYDPVPGTLKAKMNVAANSMWDELAAELHFPFERRGDYVVAIGAEELTKLEILMQQGRKNGVPGMRLLTADEMSRREPNINPDVSGALWASTGGICDPFAVTVAAAENAVQNGATVYLETAFNDFLIVDNRVVGIRTNRGVISCRWAVNAAGLYADDVMHRAGVRPEFHITPQKGEYFVFDRTEIKTNNVIFPVPSEVSKGILVTTTLHGNTIVGPNSNAAENKDDKAVTIGGMDEIWRGGLKLIPDLNKHDIISAFAGLRASGNGPCNTPGVDYQRDFIIEVPGNIQGLVNLGGIESPGFTSTPAIAQRVVELLKDEGEALKERAEWQPVRPARPRFRDLSRDEQDGLIRNDPRYGRIICRCETVTEGEILAEMRAPIPALNYDAIKRRTWLGTGRCQGAFDMPRVVNIIAGELGISPREVTKKGPGSEFLGRPTKQVDG